MEKIEHKVQEDDLLRKCRKREKVFKRMFIYNMMFNHDIQVTQIGRFFNRNHASIINALKVYENLKSTKDQELIAVLFEYMKYFEQYDIKKCNIQSEKIYAMQQPFVTLVSCGKDWKVIYIMI